MAQPKKFGTFGGVFTPSILTILGVIMYMRLPWVVGQAGLYVALGIIVVAHIISFTTGFSVASIATDKKVRVGGNYYIISRSLGLPIGGTIGLALFVGLSISVSLYIIGFIESFLPVWELALTKANIRLFGTIAVIVLTAIVVISTSLAIRIQYFIMAAIGLSLLSIMFGSSEFAPAQPVLDRYPGGEPVMLLFGIFFPAVTGFTAGVQMSGDLRDPKRSLPVGTIASIMVGFVVYVGLAIFMAFRIEADSLVNNTNVLEEIALVPGLLYAGIWGATLSSAVGSLLGAPRILQATSMDRITPRFFAAGHGPENEPRNALILTFIIAEIGILIAELNVIAAIISVFFITTYGFINLSCAVENWASADFRPSFRIPTWVSIVGATFCILVMIQLDMVSFIGSSIIMTLLFLYLKRRELTLESGDTWEGIWSSVIRAGLLRISQTVLHTRNWRPNIILFSGGTAARPHLIEFGKWIVRRRGILTNFDLLEGRHDGVLFPKPQQVLTKSDEAVDGIYSRRLECTDIYEGMRTIAQIYGFSGVEPNTVLMGWARNSRDPLRFAEALHHFTDLDYNVLMLDYDRKRGFGEKELIDIWWRGGNNNATLALTLLKFLMASDDWQKATARILLLVDDSAITNRVYKNMIRILDEHRVEAQVKIINAGIDHRSFPEICKEVSSDADLIMLGIPAITEANAASFVQDVNSIVAELGSTLLVHASSYFETLYVGVDGQSAPRRSIPAGTVDADLELPALTLLPGPGAAGPANELVVHNLTTVSERFEDAMQGYGRDCLDQFAAHNRELLVELGRLYTRSVKLLTRATSQLQQPRNRKLASHTANDFTVHCRRALERFAAEQISVQQEVLTAGLEKLTAQWEEIVIEMPERCLIHFEGAAAEPEVGDGIAVQWLKIRRRLGGRLFRQPITVKLPLRRLLAFHVECSLRESLWQQLESLGVASYHMISEIQKWLNSCLDHLQALELQRQAAAGSPPEATTRESLQERLAQLQREFDDQVTDWVLQLRREHRQALQQMSAEVFRLEALRRIRKNYRMPKRARARDEVLAVPAHWARNQELMSHFAVMDLHLMTFRHRLSRMLGRATRASFQDTADKVVARLERLRNRLKELAIDSSAITKSELGVGGEAIPNLDEEAVVRNLTSDIRSAIDELPEEIVIISEESFRELGARQYGGVEVLTVNFRRMVDYLVETELIDPLQQEMFNLPRQLQQATEAADDVIRLIQYNLENDESPAESTISGSNEPLPDILATSCKRIAQEEQHLRELLENFNNTVQEALSACQDKMNPYLMTRAAGNLGQYIRSHESRKVITGFSERLEGLIKLWRARLVQLLYRTRRGLLYARRFAEADEAEHSTIASLLNLVEKASPRSEVLNALPRYYRQLFVGKQPIGRELWVEAKPQLDQARLAIARYRHGHHGALLILGEPFSGKTALSRRLAIEAFGERQVFRLFPPEGGTEAPAVFKDRLEKVLHASGNYDTLFRTIPAGSAIIINDLEMWWERSPTGLQVVDEIIGLINRYGDRCFFVVNANVWSFRLIDRLRGIKTTFLDIIRTEPFDAEGVQRAIMLRHRSTGLKFELDGIAEDALAELKTARLFTKIFDYSAGNIGIALQAWIRSVVGVVGDRLILQFPQRPEVRALDSVQAEWLIWLQQLVLHKQLTRERLARLFHVSQATVADQLRTLRRAGLVNELPSGALQISPYVQAFVCEHLADVEML